MYATLDVHNCLPQGYKKNPGDMRSFMSAEEISRLVKALSELGAC